MPPAMAVYFGILPPQDQFVLRTVVCLLLGTAGLLAKFGDNMTPHIALTWEPAILSGSLILNAAYEGKECPVDVEVG